MADKKAKKNTLTHAELAAYLDENPPPEMMTVVVEIGDGKEVDFHFRRSLGAFERYIKNITERDGEGRLVANPITANSIFLIDSAVKEEREVLAKFIQAYPGAIGDIAGPLADLYTAVAKVTVKNASRPAG